MAAWADFHPHVLVYVPGCPDPLVEQELRRAAAEFFTRSLAWMEWLPEIVTTADERTYNLVLPAGAEIVRLEQATADDRPIEVSIHREQMADPATVPSGERAATTGDRQTLTLLRTVPVGTRLRAQVSLMPSLTAASLPDRLFTKHLDAIVSGARFRLKRMPGPLNDPKGAQLARDEFESAIAATSVGAWRGHTSQTPRARPKWC